MNLPDHLLGIIWKGKYKGQKQKWFLMRCEDNEINIKNKKTRIFRLEMDRFRSNYKVSS